MSPLLLDKSPECAEPHPIDIIRDILQDAGSLSRLMEVHYLVQEPGLLEIMRGLAALPDGDRGQLQAFLSRNGFGLRVAETLGGGLVLKWADATQLDKSA